MGTYHVVIVSVRRNAPLRFEREVHEYSVPSPSTPTVDTSIRWYHTVDKIKATSIRIPSFNQLGC
jgi:hypothetical protein